VKPGVAEFVGAQMVASLRVEGARRVKKGDRFFLVRQLEYFRQRYEECKCQPAHSCDGCEVTFEIGLALALLTEEQREQTDVHGSANQTGRAADMWRGMRSGETSGRAMIEKRWGDIFEKRTAKAHKSEKPEKPAELPLEAES